MAAAPTNLTIDFLGPYGVMINWTDYASAMPFIVNDTVWQGLWKARAVEIGMFPMDPR